MYVTAVVLAAGKGLRLIQPLRARAGLKSKISKPLIKIDSKPLIIYSLNTLGKHPYIKDIIVVANRRNLQNLHKIIKRFHIDKIKDVILGGEARQDSVANGLRAIDNHTDLVLIHDGVRPFIDRDIVSSVIKAAKRYKAAIVGVPVKATIKEVTSDQLSRMQLYKEAALRDPEATQKQTLHSGPVTSKFIVRKTLDRSKLWEIQTPQVFRKDLILKAYKKFGNINMTDDAALVEKLGRRVKLVMGSYLNIKITTPEDLIIAEAILKMQKSKCKNQNFDI